MNNLQFRFHVTKTVLLITDYSLLITHHYGPPPKQQVKI